MKERGGGKKVSQRKSRPPIPTCGKIQISTQFPGSHLASVLCKSLGAHVRARAQTRTVFLSTVNQRGLLPDLAALVAGREIALF